MSGSDAPGWRDRDNGWESQPFDPDSKERFVVVAGDWHSDLVHMLDTVPRLLSGSFPQSGQQPSTLLHVGDFNIGTGSRASKRFILKAAELAASRRMRILITPGNHDSWSRLEGRADFSRGEPARLHGAVWALPRGYRFRVGGRDVLSFGGAGSMSRPSAQENKSWWRSEMPSDAETDASITRGRADIIVSHEGPGGGTERVDARLARSRLRNPLDQAYTDLGRMQLARLWDGVQPRFLFHGHHHVHAEGHHDGRSVYALNQNGEPGNLVALDLRTMSVQWLDGTPIRNAGGP